MPQCEKVTTSATGRANVRHRLFLVHGGAQRRVIERAMENMSTTPAAQPSAREVSKGDAPTARPYVTTNYDLLIEAALHDEKELRRMLLHENARAALLLRKIKKIEHALDARAAAPLEMMQKEDAIQTQVPLKVHQRTLEMAPKKLPQPIQVHLQGPPIRKIGAAANAHRLHSYPAPHARDYAVCKLLAFLGTHLHRLLGLSLVLAVDAAFFFCLLKLQAVSNTGWMLGGLFVATMVGVMLMSHLIRGFATDGNVDRAMRPTKNSNFWLAVSTRLFAARSSHQPR